MAEFTSKKIVLPVTVEPAAVVTSTETSLFQYAMHWIVKCRELDQDFVTFARHKTIWIGVSGVLLLLAAFLTWLWFKKIRLLV